MGSSPLLALIVFMSLAFLTVLLFRPGKGYFWIITRGIRRDQKEMTEDILKRLYHLEYQGQQATLNDLLGSLPAGPDEVVKNIALLETKGLISSDSGRLGLKSRGREYALRIIRVHRLWEKYLAEETGINPLEWHDRAEKMEHLIDMDDAERLATKLGNPRYDPHGDPIPTMKGEIAPMKGMPLSSYPADTPGRIVHIEDEPETIYKQIVAEDLRVGSQVRVLESNENRIRFHCEGEEYVLAPIIAANISVAELDRREEAEVGISRLSSLGVGEKALVIGISRGYRGSGRRRLLDLGFVPGTQVSPALTSPMKDPRAYSVRNALIALRKEQADLILVKRHENK